METKTNDFLTKLRKGAPTEAPVRVPEGTPGAFQVHAAGSAATLQPGFYKQPAPTVATPAPAEAPTTESTLPAWAQSKTPYAGVASVSPSQAPPAQINIPPAQLETMRTVAIERAAAEGGVKLAPINPPESALAPAPPVGAAAPATEPKKRGRPAGSKAEPVAESSAPSIDAVPELAAFMRQHGLKRLGFNDAGQVRDIEVAS